MSDIERLTVTELVAAYRAGNRGAFAGIYDRYADRIFSYNVTVLRDREDAADATHDAFIEAATRMDQLQRPEQLRPWLFAIARNEAHARGRHRSRMRPEKDLSEPLDDPDLVVIPAPAALRPRVLDKVDEGVGAVPAPSLPPEWIRIGIFAAVALVVGLIGLAVSAQFDPLPAPSTLPVAEGPVAGGDSTTTTGATATTAPSSTSTTAAGPPTSTTAAGGPAAIGASTDTVNFGGDGTVAEFDLTNTGGRTGEWTLVSSTDAIAVSVGSGEVGAGDTVTIDLSLNRDEIEEGEIAETLTVTWAGGQIPISVVGTHEANPVIHNPQASPPSVDVSGSPDCLNTQTTISARVRDASPLESVIVRWSPGSGPERETPMGPIGNDMFEAVIGPFTAVQTASVRVVAFDDRGNAGGANIPVAVVACP